MQYFQIISFFDMDSFSGWESDFRLWWSNGFTVRLVLTFFVAALTVSWLIKKLTRASLPPGPRGLPLLGNLPFLEPELHRYFARLSQSYGPIFKLQLGSKICIVVSSPTVAKIICKDQDAVFANRDVPVAGKTATYGGIDVGWSPNGPQWRKLRKIFANHMMSNTSLDACYALRRAEVREMVKEIHKNVGSPINICEQLSLALLNVMLSMLWGGSLHGEEKRSIGVEFWQVVVEIVGLVGKPNVSDLFPLLSPFDLQGINSKSKKLTLWVDRIFESIIDARRKNEDEGKTSKDLLHFLLELNRQGDDQSSYLSMDEIKAMFMDVVTAGTDTTSTTLEWALTEMLQHPEITARIQEELEEIVGIHNIVEESHLPKLTYLDAFIKETLRLHPALPLQVPRSPSKSCHVSGFAIPQGSQVLINSWAIQRDPEVWENPGVFDPERFLGNGKVDYSGNDLRFIPFGSGRRICAGMPLAERTMKYVLATLVHSFEWKLPNGVVDDVSDKFGFVLKRKTPLVVVPIARLPTMKQYD